MLVIVSKPNKAFHTVGEKVEDTIMNFKPISCYRPKQREKKKEAGNGKPVNTERYRATTLTASTTPSLPLHQLALTSATGSAAAKGWNPRPSKPHHCTWAPPPHLSPSAPGPHRISARHHRGNVSLSRRSSTRDRTA